MAVISFAADSTTLVLNGYAFSSFIAGDTMILAPVNDFSSHTNATDGGVNIQRRVDGDVYTLTLSLQRLSDDDIYLNSAINQDEPTVFSGSVKENFIKDEVSGVESWTLSNGSITSRPTSTKNDQEGNALSEYVLTFRSCKRSI